MTQKATGIGETLRDAREERGLSLSDVAEDTAISKRRLQALEDERFELLEGDVYVTSSLRLYGRFLKIDPEPLVDAYREQHGEVVVQAPAQPVEEYPERISPVVAFAVVALVAVVGFGVIGWLTGSGEPAETVAVITEFGGEEPAVAPAPAPDPTEEPADAPAGDATDGATDGATSPAGSATSPPPLSEADEVEVALNLDGGASWVRVLVDDETVLERILEDGFSETFTGDEIEMRLGNAGVTDLVVNGEDLSDFSSGAVVDVTCVAGQSSCTVE